MSEKKIYKMLFHFYQLVLILLNKVMTQHYNMDIMNLVNQ